MFKIYFVCIYPLIFTLIPNSNSNLEKRHFSALVIRLAPAQLHREEGTEKKKNEEERYTSTQVLFEAYLWFSPSAKQRCKLQKPHCPVSSSTCLSMCCYLIRCSLHFSMLRGKTSTKVAIGILTCKLAPSMKPKPTILPNFAKVSTNSFNHINTLKKKTPKLWKRMGKLLEYLFSTSNKPNKLLIKQAVCHLQQLELFVRTACSS